jgi:ABC-type glycerol-3-phosphate transport system substrate-binding protein
MARTVRFMQEEYFSYQTATFPAFTRQTGIEVAADLLAIDLELNDPFIHEARLAFGDRPRWDLLAPEEGLIAWSVGRGLVEPLGERIRRDGFDIEDFPTAALDCYSVGGEVYGVPYMAMANVLIYRKDLLDRYELPVPQTWDQLRRVALNAQAALRRDGIEDVVGFTSRGLAGYGHNFWIVGSTIFPSWGWSWDRGPGAPPRVHEPATVDALAFYAALLREAGPAESAQMTFIQTHQHYARGKAVFLVDAATELATMLREGPESPGTRSSMAMVPTGPTRRPEPGLYCPAYCIPDSCRVKEEAWQLLRHLASLDQYLTEAVEAGYAEAARESVIRSDAYAAAYDANFVDVLCQTRALARANRPLVKHYMELGDLVGGAATSVIAGRRGADEALRACQRELDLMDWS